MTEIRDWGVGGIWKKTKLLSEKYLSQCDFVYHEFHTEWLGIELNHVAHGMAQK